VPALATAGCFNSEPQQRRAFITFLQTRIVDKPGLHIPIMSEKDVADFDPLRKANGSCGQWRKASNRSQSPTKSCAFLTFSAKVRDQDTI